MQLLSKAKHSLTAMAQKEVCPRDEIAGPPGTAMLSVDRQTWFCWRFRVFSYTVWCAIVADEICSESCDRLGSATVAGTVRDSEFQPYVLPS